MGKREGPVTIVIRALICSFTLVGHTIAAEPAGIEDTVAYSDVVPFDYTTDGVAVEDGLKPPGMKMYGGDLRVGPVR